jgi:uncharacterized repeat protein (TIGR01451 family)
VFSPDGTKVAFESDASDLGPHNANAHPDVYVRDLATGTTALVSVNAAGSDGGNQTSRQPVFSPDGTKIAFSSSASDLVANDTNTEQDVFVRDLVTGSTALISVNAAGSTSANSQSDAPVFSPDGTKVAFESLASDLGPRDLNSDWDIYVRDLGSGTNSLVSANAAGDDGGDRPSSGAVFSPDGTMIAFTSASMNLGPRVPVIAFGPAYAYLRDLTTATTSVVSIDATGTSGLAGEQPVFSPDGRRIAFISQATGFGVVDTNEAYDVYVRDLETRTTDLVSVADTGTDAGDNWSFDPAFSPDGSEIAFDSTASDLVAGEPTLGSNIYLRDLEAGTTTLVSVSARGTGEARPGGSLEPRFSADGDKILFVSSSSDLGPADGDRHDLQDDIYVRDLRKGVTTLVSSTGDGSRSGNGASREAHFSPTGDRVAFLSEASDLGPPDSNGKSDIYIADLHGADLQLSGNRSPEPVTSGGRLTYQLQLANTGPDTAEGVVVGVLLPDATVLVDVSSTAGACSPSSEGEHHGVTCNLPDHEPGDTTAVTIDVQVTAPAGSSLTATALVRADTVDPNDQDNALQLLSSVA